MYRENRGIFKLHLFKIKYNMKKSIMLMVLMAFTNIAIAKVNVSIQELMGTWKVINPT